MTKKEEAELQEAMGRRLARLRNAAGISQDELASMCGLHRNSISRYELGAAITTTVLVRLCAALNAEPGDVLERRRKE